MESRACVQSAGSSVKTDGKPDCEQAFPYTLVLGGHFLCLGEDGVPVSDAGATANLARFAIVGKSQFDFGEAQATPYSVDPYSMRAFEIRQWASRFGHYPGSCGLWMHGKASVSDADIPALLR